MHCKALVPNTGSSIKANSSLHEAFSTDGLSVAVGVGGCVARPPLGSATIYGKAEGRCAFSGGASLGGAVAL